MAEKTVVQILREFFGFKPGQGVSDFLKELQALPPAERREMGELIVAQTGDTIKAV